VSEASDRRQFLNRAVLGAAGLGAAGLGAALSLEERLAQAAPPSAPAEPASPKPPAAGNMPCGKIGNVSVSRLLIGCNLLTGWAHSRDLLYVSKLLLAYHTEQKVFETLELAEQQGLNTIHIDPPTLHVVEKYQRQRKSKLQTLIDFPPSGNTPEMRDAIKGLVDRGATLLYSAGDAADHLTRAGRIDALAKFLELVREQGVPAGIGSHSLEVPIACEKNTLRPDFYVKTFHMDRYWSALPKDKRREWCWLAPPSDAHDGWHDNMWCINPEETAAFMQSVAAPWVAFKVMAAGAIDPRMAFSYAFRHGADFILAGMFDYQIAEDAKIATEAIRQFTNRKRPWRA